MKNLLIYLLVLFSIGLEAQEVTLLSPGSVLEANFTQYRHLTGIPKPIKSGGNMLLWDGKGLIWATHTPFPNSILITKKGLYQLEGRVKTPIVKAGGESVIFDVMAGIFNMKDKGAVKGFTLEDLPSSNGNWCIRLIPQYQQVKSFIQSITVEGNAHISHITISRPNGDHDEINITDHVIKESAAPDVKELFDE